MSPPFIIIIPARLQSTRLPQKMLRMIADQSLIERTWRAALKANALQTIIATDDESIFNLMAKKGAQVVMTAIDHASGTDRLSEVVNKLAIDDDAIIVNWQGDEPFLPATLIQKVVNRLADNPSSAMSTLATKIDSWEDFYDPNIVKVVMNEAHEALYFSRAPIPYPRDLKNPQGAIPKTFDAFRHIGLYAYRAHFLKNYPALPASQLEEIERLEQLRALANHYTIAVELSDSIPPLGIDTEEDLTKAILWIKGEIKK